MGYPKDILINIVWASAENRSSECAHLAFDLSDVGELEHDGWTYNDADVRSFRIGPPHEVMISS